MQSKLQHHSQTNLKQDQQPKLTCLNTIQNNNRTSSLQKPQNIFNPMKYSITNIMPSNAHTAPSTHYNDVQEQKKSCCLDLFSNQNTNSTFNSQIQTMQLKSNANISQPSKQSNNSSLYQGQQRIQQRQEINQENQISIIANNPRSVSKQLIVENIQSAKYSQALNCQQQNSQLSTGLQKDKHSQSLQFFSQFQQNQLSQQQQQPTFIRQQPIQQTQVSQNDKLNNFFVNDKGKKNDTNESSQNTSFLKTAKVGQEIHQVSQQQSARPASMNNQKTFCQVATKQQKSGLHTSNNSDIQLQFQKQQQQKENPPKSANIKNDRIDTRKDEYLQYEKLQLKLSQLETKILNIKTNIEGSQKQQEKTVAVEPKIQKQTPQNVYPSFLKQQLPKSNQNQSQQENQYNDQQSNKNKQNNNQGQLKQNIVNNTENNLSSIVTQVKSNQNIQIRKDNTYNKPKSKSRYLIDSLFYKGELNQGARDFIVLSIQALHYAANIQADFDQIQSKKIYLPYTKFPKTLVLDLDETLIHCNESLEVQGDVILPIKFPTGEIVDASINVRPFCKSFLEKMSQIYEVIVFTASHSCYANVILDCIDPEKKYISHRLFRESCIEKDSVFIKDLRVLGNRDLKNLVIVDNATHSFAYQLENGIPIIPFYDDYSDKELEILCDYLREMNCRDIVKMNREKIKLLEWTNIAEAEQLIQLF